MEGADLLASAQRYDLTGTIDRQRVSICGIGAVCTDPARHDGCHARVLVDLERERQPAQLPSMLPDSPKSISLGGVRRDLFERRRASRNGGLSALGEELKWNRLKFKQEPPSLRP